MRVNVEGDIYISSNGTYGQYGYTLERKKLVNVLDKKTKEVIETNEVFEAIGHFTTIEQVIILGFLKLKIAESTAETLAELLADVKEIKSYVKKLLEEI